ncbi:UDP-2,3-diacylglucosamine diphosphatase [Comamonas endophytica]|uniref:UDP-2,3-diacylglucosamine hydrolase n=1 Tax=Comamonas endophytica TaxID=2949090 RepID=A0ABY6G9V7_9BURK|nr:MULTISPECIES: UDP-2,3-diacylglucosamine diphosphatase [unclassified Acidovorax]MCD2514553.1 UDP-2,3-diacylglucosamine diphosphatase [Acidovorax sp. D4N7]UYG51130.1 UDP-2,3-diacylglucosamine diphosphatase [Acidovorax sp. 5MLIR]
MAPADTPALPPPPAAHVLAVPTGWQCLEFISDLHLQASAPRTAAAWLDYLTHTSADAVFMLGDLFEVWIGDDVLDDPHSFESHCCARLREISRRRALFFMQGNRDFLTGAKFAERSGCTWLPDPTQFDFDGRRYLLSHGDALCIDDTDYQRFRAQARSAAWQQAFLQQPLETRRAQARAMREQSSAQQRAALKYAELDQEASRQWLQAAGATTLIHGHTHRPADHALAPGLQRIVLSDWDLEATPPRAEVLRLTRGRGLQRRPWPESGAAA